MLCLKLFSLAPTLFLYLVLSYIQHSSLQSLYVFSLASLAAVEVSTVSLAQLACQAEDVDTGYVVAILLDLLFALFMIRILNLKKIFSSRMLFLTSTCGGTLIQVFDHEFSVNLLERYNVVPLWIILLHLAIHTAARPGVHY